MVSGTTRRFAGVTIPGGRHHTRAGSERQREQEQVHEDRWASQLALGAWSPIGTCQNLYSAPDARCEDPAIPMARHL